MPRNPTLQKVVVIGAVCMILVGVFLMVQAVADLAGRPARSAQVETITEDRATEAVPADVSPSESTPASVSLQADITPAVPITTELPTVARAALPTLNVLLDNGVPSGLRDAVSSISLDGIAVVTTTAASAPVRFDATSGDGGTPQYTVTFAAATRFDTVEPAIAWDALRALWRGTSITETAINTATAVASMPTSAGPAFSTVAVLTETLPLLTQVLGTPSDAVTGFDDISSVITATWDGRTTLALVPFDQLEPRLAVLAIDGQNPVENSEHFDAERYPLTATVYAHVNSANTGEVDRARQLLAALPKANRDSSRLTVLAMTGVTALCRMTAEQMDRLGSAWPAEVVGPELASADITHISNEVPFVEDCVTNTDPDNFNFCSKPEYVETLFASGVDIIGMTGNHQNDFGRQNATISLEMYDEWELPYYGGGKNLEGAFEPLFIEQNGNRLAFLGANSYGPKMAWATDALPGAAPFDLNILSATIRSIKEKDLADVVLVELQYQESYDTQPLADQRLDFNALARAGADIVTGVQSHVPQGMEFTDGRLVLYGLGNLYFDQMWGQATREGMIVKHTIYDGRHISTQILTTLLYDYGQPRWTTPQERESILDRVFAASYW